MNKRVFAFLALAAVVLSLLFVWFRPAPQPAEPAPAPQAFAFSVRDGARVAGPAVIKLRQGAAVRLVVNTDSDDELHVHGYDKTLDIDAGEPAMLAFTADQAGRFEVELHASHIALTVLEVAPE